MHAHTSVERRNHETGETRAAPLLSREISILEISLRECFIRSLLFLTKSVNIRLVCLVYYTLYLLVIAYLNQIRQAIKLMLISNCETIFLELDQIPHWIAFPPVKLKQQTITKQLVKNNSHTYLDKA